MLVTNDYALEITALGAEARTNDDDTTPLGDRARYVGWVVVESADTRIPAHARRGRSRRPLTAPRHAEIHDRMLGPSADALETDMPLPLATRSIARFSAFSNSGSELFANRLPAPPVHADCARTMPVWARSPASAAIVALVVLLVQSRTAHAQTSQEGRGLALTLASSGAAVHLSVLAPDSVQSSVDAHSADVVGSRTLGADGFEEQLSWASPQPGTYLVCATGEAGASAHLTLRAELGGRAAARELAVSGALGTGCSRGAAGFLTALEIHGSSATGALPTTQSRVASPGVDANAVAAIATAEGQHLADPFGEAYPDSDHDRIPNALDECPQRPETVNGDRDEDGCPDNSAVRDLLWSPWRAQLVVGFTNFGQFNNDRYNGPETYVESGLHLATGFRIFGFDVGTRFDIGFQGAYSIAFGEYGLSPFTIMVRTQSGSNDGFVFEPLLSGFYSISRARGYYSSGWWVNVGLRAYYRWPAESQALGLQIQVAAPADSRAASPGGCDVDTGCNGAPQWIVNASVLYGFGELF